MGVLVTLLKPLLNDDFVSQENASYPKSHRNEAVELHLANQDDLVKIHIIVIASK